MATLINDPSGLTMAQSLDLPSLASAIADDLTTLGKTPDEPAIANALKLCGSACYQSMPDLSSYIKRRRGMFVWNTSGMLSGGSMVANRDELLDFAETSGINRLIVNGYPDVVSSDSAYDDEKAEFRNLIAEATQRAIAIEILYRDPTWPVLGNGETWPGATQQWVTANIITPTAQFWASCPSNAKPDAIHFDVEPQALGDWGTRTVSERQDLIKNLCQLYTDARSSLDAGGANEMAIAADVPAWWDGTSLDLPDFSYNAKTQSAFAHVLDHVDRLLVMAYSDMPSGITSAAELEVLEATKAITIAVETDPSIPGGVSLTQGKTTPDAIANVSAAVAAVESAYGSNISYDSLTFHTPNDWHQGASFIDVSP